MNETYANVDPDEVAKFEALAADWWDPQGHSKPLHQLNPVRLGFITDRINLAGLNAIDVGCGGGILSEALAKQGAQVSGIDMAESALMVARLHAQESKLDISYERITAEQKAADYGQQFDVVTCMEMLEHVPNPAAIVQACADLVKPGGHVFLSTLNRHPKAYLLAVLGAEYIMSMLPRGTHDYKRFIRPSELSGMCRTASLTVTGIKGMHYNLLNQQFSLGDDVKVNFLLHCTKT